MKILFAFENPLPSSEADAEVFMTTAKYLSPLTEASWLHVPTAGNESCASTSEAIKMPVVRALAPTQPAAFRHLCCGLTLVFRRKFRQADLVYTRNLWIAWMSVLFGQRVVYDHYRPWPDQIPPLQFTIYRLFCNPLFLLHICHSQYTCSVYESLGVPKDKLYCVHNGFEPRRLQLALNVETAKQRISVDPQTKTVVYTGRINHKKGLELVIEAAKRLPELQFILVGSRGEGVIEKLAATIPNLRIVGWQPAERLGDYIYAADVLLIPPSTQPLATFGTTVLPLKLFLYLASGRPIVAGDTVDVREVLRHNENAYLCAPDQLHELVSGINAVINDTALGERLGVAAKADSGNFTWNERARKIAEIVEARLRTPSVESGHWSSAHSGRWRRQSLRWLNHLFRTRSWILPPEAQVHQSCGRSADAAR